MAWDENGRYTVHGGIKLYSFVRENSPFAKDLDRMSDRIEKVSFPPPSSSSPVPPPPTPHP